MGIVLDLTGRRSDGADFPVEISLAPVDTDDGIHVFATVVDVSERKAAERELLQAQKLESIGRLAGGIAHDFNNMLFAISGYAELLDQDLTVGNGLVQLDVARRNVVAIRDAASRAADLTSQLLAFSRQQVVIPRVVDLNAAVRGLEPMLQPLIGENVHLTLRLDADPGRIRADPGQLDQMLVNLVVNARDAMPAGGDVRIQTTRAVFDERDLLRHVIGVAGAYVLLTVSDTGVGMDRATRERVFEPFFTTKELGKGTGLGLATIYGIVHQAGGHIRVYSEPDTGSVFKLYFPAVSEAVSAEPAVHVAPASVRSGTILLVEDEPFVRDMTTQLLERSGYRVTAVSDAARALEEIDAGERPPDALVTDVVMPGTSGIELAELILERHPEAGIVLLSGYTAETLDLERLIRQGAVFVSKPVSTSELLRAIDRVTRRHGGKGKPP
jgi:two-component system cell cycle sensor histidine kinase/response regulator CckA